MQRAFFSTKFGIVAAAAGSAVGLGNIWKFPYEVGQSGGAAFLLVYIICVLAIGLPIMIAEFIVGRSTHSNGVGAFKKLSNNNIWQGVGFLGIFTAFIILCFYFVVAGWGLEYVYQAVTNSFSGKNPVDLTNAFKDFAFGSFRPLFWLSIFILITASIIWNGVEKGIERYSKFLMPFLFLSLIILMIRALLMEGSFEGVKFFLQPDFSKINGDVVLSALGQAFFSLSIGMCTMVTYGSYIKKDNNLVATAFNVTIVDLLIAILAGLVIFPSVFAMGINPAEGPHLVFVTLPSIFSNIFGGYILSIIFFSLLSVAALTSTISLYEVVIIYMIEELKLSRKKSIAILTFALITLSIATSLSLIPEYKMTIFGKSLFDAFEYASFKIFMPLGGLCLSVFVGWFIPKQLVKDELTNKGKVNNKLFEFIYFSIKFIAPIVIATIFFFEL